MITTVVVPVDDQHTSERAIPVAGWLARLTGATVELVGVDPLGLSPEETQARLDAVAGTLPPGIATATTVEATTDSVAGALAHLARPPGALLCLATHGRGSVVALALGSVTANVIQHTDLPVLVVGPGCRAQGPSDLEGSALVALDGTVTDDTVMAAALLWARATHAPLVAATVVTRPSDPGAWSDADGILAWAEEHASDVGLTLTTSLVAAADPDEGILRLLDDGVGCLVVGSHRRGRLGRLALGSTVTRLAHRAPCPVLVAAPTVPELATAGATSSALGT